MSRVFCTLVMAFVLSLPASARTGGQQSLDEEQKQGALLLKSVISDSRSLAIPENRIAILIRAVDLVWRSDEKQARALVADAIKCFNEITSGLKDVDPDYQQRLETVFQLRQEMLLGISRHDSRTALEFLRATRQPVPPQYDQQYRRPDFEAELETRLAMEIAERDAAEALRFAQEALASGFSSNLTALISQLESKDPAAAAKLAKLFIGKVRSEDIRRSPGANSTAFYLMNRAMELGRPPFQLRQEDPRPQPLIDEKDIGGLKGTVFGAAVESLSNPQPYTYSSIMDQLMPLMPEFEGFVGTRAPELLAKVNDYRVTKNAQMEVWKKYEDLERRSVDALVQAIPQAPAELRDNLYQKAAWKAFDEGDVARAKSIIEEGIADPRQQTQQLASIIERQLWRAAEDGKVAEVRQRISQIPSAERRVQLLIVIHNRILEAGNKRLALELLEEARGETSRRPGNYSELMTQLELADAYARIEPARGFEIVERNIALLNENAAAAKQLDGFDTNYFDEGELLLFRTGQLMMALNRCAESLRALGRADFNRAKASAELFQMTEARLLARLAVAEGVLIDPAEKRPVLSSGLGGFGRRSSVLLILRQ